MAEMTPAPRAQAVLDYWFGEGWANARPDDTRPEKAKVWFRGGPEVDAEIVSLFLPDCEALLAGQYDGWRTQPLGALAGIILGDQLFRNAFRGTAKMYAADERVLAWAKQLVASGTDRQLAPIQRVWVYMPFMHSEELADQDECISQFDGLSRECEAAGWPAMAKMTLENVKYARAHREVVAKWGRFPHRNAILGRQNTSEEAQGIAAGTIPKW